MDVVHSRTWPTQRSPVAVVQKLGTTVPVEKASYQRAHRHSDGAWNAESNMTNPVLMLRRRESAQQAPELSEEAWQHRIDKRGRAIASLKDTDMYRLCAGTRPRTPDPADRALGKRQWDEVVTQWKRALRSAGLQANSGPQELAEEQEAKHKELASSPRVLRNGRVAATHIGCINGSGNASFCQEGSGEVGRRVSLKHCPEDSRSAPRDAGARRWSTLGAQRRASDAEALDEKESLKAWTKGQEEAQAVKESRKKLRRTLAFVAFAVLGLAFDQLVFEKLAGSPARQRVQVAPIAVLPRTVADTPAQLHEPGSVWTSMESGDGGENVGCFELDNSENPVGACARHPLPTASD